MPIIKPPLPPSPRPRTEGNARLTLQAANSGTRIITAMARFEVDLDRETTYRLLTAPEYVQPDCLLPGDPHILAGPRQTLARSLSSDCPETAATDLYDLEDLADYLKIALEPDGDTCPPAARQLEFPDFLIPLTDILPPAASVPRSTASGRQPKPKRDKSGTKAGQTRPRFKNIKQDQIDRLNQKRSATNSAKACQNGLPPSFCPLPPAHCSSDPCSLVPDPCLLEPQTVFAAPPVNPPAADDSQEILDEQLAAELAVFLKNFAPYASPAQDPDTSTILPPDTNTSPSSLIPDPCLPNPSSPIPPPCPPGNVGQESEAPPAIPGTDAPSASITPEPQTPSPATGNDLLPNPCSLVPDPCPLETDVPPDFFITGNKRPASFPFAAAPAPPIAEEPGSYDQTSNDLFLMTHGYPRDNPPKHIPNRRLDEDVRGFSLFREIKKYF